jgi:HEAT repeat protein
MNTRKRFTKTSILVGLIAGAAIGAFLLAPVLPCPAGQPKGGQPKANTPAPSGAIPGATLAGQNPALSAILEKLPRDQGMYIGPDWTDSAPYFETVLKGGKANIQTLVDMLIDNTKLQPNQMEDYKVRWLLHGAVVLAPKQGEPQRQMVAEALEASLKPDQGKYVQAFVIQELLWCAGPEQIPALAKYLSDDLLYDYAIRTLQNIGPAASPAILAALPASKGRPRMAIVQTLGSLRDAKAVPEILEIAADKDRDMRVTAMDALANIGDAAAMPVLLAAVAKAPTDETFEHIKACEDSLLLAKRLIESGDSANAAKIYTTLAQSPATANERHVRIAAVQGAAMAKGDVASLVAALKSDDFQIRESTLDAITNMPGPVATKIVTDLLGQAGTPAEKVGFLNVLGTRKDATALPAVVAQLKNDDDQVRSAAANAAAAIGGKEATAALLAMLGSTNAKDQQIASGALRNLSGKEGDAAVATAYAKATDGTVKANLLAVLGAHRAADQMDTIMMGVSDKDAQVRAAGIKALGSVATESQLPLLAKALKDSKDGNEVTAAKEALQSACGRQMAEKVADLVAPIASAAAPNGPAAILVLSTAGGAKALAAVVAAGKQGQGEVKDVAIRTLADWRGKEAAAPLLDIAGSAEGNLKVLALRGVVRMASDRTTPAEERLKLLGPAMKLASRQEEKRDILGALGSIPTAAALTVAAASLDDDQVREEACQAVVKISQEVVKTNAAAVKDPLTKVSQVARDNRLRDNAKRILDQAAKKG